MSSTSKNKMVRSGFISTLALCLAAGSMLSGCADAVGPKARNVSIPAPKVAEERSKAINENSDPVIYLPLGDDVLMPQSEEGDPLPSTIVGPYELRGETLAGALQLVLDGTNVPIAFETEDSLNKIITITNLQGPLDSVVREICSLGDMYCSYQNGMLVVKDTQIFTVSIPPIVSSDGMSGLMTSVSGAIGSITGAAPITDTGTRTIVYRASQRTSEVARRYFQRLRSNTALVVFETYVWEVSLDSGNTTGIKWSTFDKIGRFKFGVNLSGSADPNVGSPISIGLPTTGVVDFDVNDVFQFVSSYGAVRTVSQPQITVLSGSSAKLRVADTQNYVASLSRTTTDGGSTTVSTTTDSVDSGFTLNIGSNWDNSTVYGNISILLQEVRRIDTFDDNPDAVVQLPQTTERELETQVRIRPGDLLLIAGLVRETDALDKEGIGLSEPSLPLSRAAQASNTELVFLLRPRVVVFTSEQSGTPKKGEIPPRIEQTMVIPPTLTPLASEPVTSVVPPVAQAPQTQLSTSPELPENPVSVVETPTPKAKIQPEVKKVAGFDEIIDKTSMASVVNSARNEEEGIPPPYEVAPIEHSTPAVEVNMPDSVPQNAQSKPSVIVNYDILGR
ncbi:MAG: type II and III secretion system family protein [Micavibrio sp.]|nr:type II and III secretion system family protein [Micavibrio sp.]